MSNPLIEVLDSSILAEYGNCDRLLEVLEVLEQSEEIPDPILSKTIVPTTTGTIVYLS